MFQGEALDRPQTSDLTSPHVPDEWTGPSREERRLLGELRRDARHLFKARGPTPPRGSARADASLASRPRGTRARPPVDAPPDDLVRRVRTRAELDRKREQYELAGAADARFVQALVNVAETAPPWVCAFLASAVLRALDRRMLARGRSARHALRRALGDAGRIGWALVPTLGLDWRWTQGGAEIVGRRSRVARDRIVRNLRASYPLPRDVTGRLLAVVEDRLSLGRGAGRPRADGTGGRVSIQRVARMLATAEGRREFLQPYGRGAPRDLPPRSERPVQRPELADLLAAMGAHLEGSEDVPPLVDWRRRPAIVIRGRHASRVLFLDAPPRSVPTPAGRRAYRMPTLTPLTAHFAWIASPEVR